MHVFVDASHIAFAASANIKVSDVDDDMVSSTLIIAKTRVAPVKSKSIPRLELDSAPLGTQLVAKCAKALGMSLKKPTLWSDLMTSCHWI